MIDMFALLVSTGMMAIVVFFAIRLNREREWFEKPQPSRPAARNNPPGRGIPTGRTNPASPDRPIPARAAGRGGRPWRRDA